MTLRKPLFFVSCVLIVLVVLVELGSSLVAAFGRSSPGLGIGMMAFVDGALLFSVAALAAPLLTGHAAMGKSYGIIALIFSILVALAAFVAIMKCLVSLFLMIGLLMAMPFGPAVYGIMFGGFPVGAARATLGAIMTMKLVFAGCLVFAHPRFAQMKALVFLIATSLVAGIIVSFLHGLVGSFLVSVTDAIAGIVVGIIGLIWAIFILITSIPSIFKAVT
ncbi:MAG: hypothetical protein IH987_09115 [Planctomycetes bacterium]|nr:hypothetical protein [Planctomycetota bacterium]